VSGVGLLILFAILGAFICAKTRSPSGAVVFSLIALVLFIGTPVGQSVPAAVGKVMSTVDQATTPALNGGEARADTGTSR
jgi:hypothetical protein